MTFSLVANTISAQATVALMMRQLQLFEKWEISGTLWTWQLEDMDRHKYPGFKGGPLPHSVSTRIWQHTHGRHFRKWLRRKKVRGRRAEMVVVHDKYGRAKLRRKHRRSKITYQRPEKPLPTTRRSSKPILRPFLVDELRVRLRNDMKEKINW